MTRHIHYRYKYIVRICIFSLLTAVSLPCCLQADYDISTDPAQRSAQPSPAIALAAFTNSALIGAPSAVLLHNRTIDTSHIPSQLPAHMASERKLSDSLVRNRPATDENRLVSLLVQLTPPVTEQAKQALRQSGARIHSYIPNNTFLIHSSSVDIDRIAALPFVRWIGEYGAADKLDPQLLAYSASAMDQTESTATESAEMIDIVVHAFSSGTVFQIAEAIAPYSGTIHRISVLPQETFFRVTMPASLIDTLSAITGIEWIEPYVEAQLCNDVVSSADGINVKAVKSVLGLTGRNQLIGHADSGIDIGSYSSIHPDLAGRIKIARAYGRYNDWSDINGHGTHTAGTIVGTGAAYPNAKFKGIAYEARLVHQSIMDKNHNISAAVFDLYHLFYSAYYNGARIHSDSWGATTSGGYTWMSKAADRFMWDYKDMLLVFAAGNDGSDRNKDGIIDSRTVSAPATAKNVLAVGAAETWRYPGLGGYTGYSWVDLSRYNYPAEPVANDLISYSADGYHRGIAAFSNRGPTADGRIKPDIVTPGTDIISCRSRDPNAGEGWGVFNNSYIYWGGTSMATPVASGAAALVRQYVIETLEIPTPSAALIKAILINGAVSLTPGQYGFGTKQEIPSERPNIVEGWGLVDLENTLIESVGGRITVHDDDALQTGGTNTYTIVVPATKKLSITLAYTDYPASLASKIKLVNDLDLCVISPAATANACNTNSTADRLNNIENIEIGPISSGTTTVQVIGYTVPYGPQPYALVIRESTYSKPEFEIDYLDYNPWVVRPDVPVSIDAHVTADTGSIKKVELYYRRKPDDWQVVSMTYQPGAQTGANYTGIIPGQPLNELIEYYVKAESSSGAVDFSGLNSFPVNENVLYVSKNMAKPPPFNYTGITYTNIQEAIYRALDGAIVLVNNGVYSGYMVDITRGITVRSINGPKKTKIDGMKIRPCVTISGNNAVLDGFTLQNGASGPTRARQSGAGVRCYEGAMVKNCIIKNNISERHGGGVYFDYGGTVSNCIVKNNTGTYAGGGIYCNRGGTVINSQVTKNKTYAVFGDGAGIYCFYGGFVTNSLVEKNSAGHDGGGIYAVGKAVIYGSTISKNKTKNAGAGVYIRDNAVVEDCTIVRNKSKLYAGGVYCGKKGFLRNSTISTNKAVRGGGIHSPEGNIFNCHISKNKATYGGGLELIDGISTGCVIQYNYATDGGGAVIELRSTLSDAVIRNNKAETGGGLYLYQDSIASNCTITANKATYGGGLATGQNSETIDSTIVNNSARKNGGGVYMIPNRNTVSPSIVHRSLIAFNQARKNGGGVFTLETGLLRNSVVEGNSAKIDGGGIYFKQGGIVENSTIIKNTAARGGGTLSMNGGSVNNTIIYFNESNNGANVFNASGGTYEFCCLEPLIPGEGNIDAPPHFFAGNTEYQPSSESPCIDAGRNLDWMYGNTDYRQIARIINATVDIGCYEYGDYTDNTPPQITITSPLDWTVYPVASNTVLIAGTVSDNLGIQKVSRNGSPVKTLHENDWEDKSSLVPGTNQFQFIAVDAFGLSATTMLHCILTPQIIRPGIPGVTNFVSLSGEHIWPYTNWFNAATNLQDAVTAAVTGNYVLIDPGIYYLPNAVIVSQPITIAGTTLPEETVLHGRDTHRCLNLIGRNVRVLNLTVTHGKGPFGGGIHCKDGGYIENCIIEENAASQVAGGLYFLSEGIVTNSIIRNNTSANVAGGLSLRTDGLAIGCTIYNNTSSGSGGGVVCDSYARVENCIISHNTSGTDGGGVACNPFATIIDCTINNNTAKNGGGINCYQYTLIQNCIITSNTATKSAGIEGLYAWIRNNLIAFNISSSGAGGVYLRGGGFLQSCTVVKNRSLESVGGIQCDNNSQIENCIIVNNSGVTQNNYKNSGEAVEYYNNCIKPQISGGANISSDPQFRNAANGDFRLSGPSPCINSGASDAWMILARDLDGTKRIVGNIPDRGAYEYPLSLSLTLDANETEGDPPLPVSFSSRISGDQPQSLWYLWDLDGDGTIDANGSELSQLDHQYTQLGLYSVSLSISNSYGILATATRTNLIDVLPEPLITPIFLLYGLIICIRRS